MKLEELINKEPIPLSRPIVKTGAEILDASSKKLHIIMQKDEENMTADDLKIKSWLGRLEVVLRRDNKYSLSIDEAVNCGLID